MPMQQDRAVSRRQDFLSSLPPTTGAGAAPWLACSLDRELEPAVLTLTAEVVRGEGGRAELPGCLGLLLLALLPP